MEDAGFFLGWEPRRCLQRTGAIPALEKACAWRGRSIPASIAALATPLQQVWCVRNILRACRYSSPASPAHSSRAPWASRIPNSCHRTSDSSSWVLRMRVSVEPFRLRRINSRFPRVRRPPSVARATINLFRKWELGWRLVYQLPISRSTGGMGSSVSSYRDSSGGREATPTQSEGPIAAQQGGRRRARPLRHREARRQGAEERIAAPSFTAGARWTTAAVGKERRTSSTPSGPRTTSAVEIASATTPSS